MTVQESYIQLLQAINDFQSKVELEGELLNTFQDIRKKAEQMKRAAATVYYEQKNEVQTLNRVVDEMRAADVSFFNQYNNNSRFYQEVYLHNDTPPLFIRLHPYIIPLKEIKGINQQTNRIVWLDKIYELSPDQMKHLIKIIFPYIAQPVI